MIFSNHKSQNFDHSNMDIHTSVSAVNTCDIFRAFPVSVVVTYPNTFGFDVSRTTQQTLVIS